MQIQIIKQHPPQRQSMTIKIIQTNPVAAASTSLITKGVVRVTTVYLIALVVFVSPKAVVAVKVRVPDPNFAVLIETLLQATEASGLLRLQPGCV